MRKRCVPPGVGHSIWFPLIIRVKVCLAAGRRGESWPKAARFHHSALLFNCARQWYPQDRSPINPKGSAGAAKRRHPGASGGGPSGKAVREYFAWCNLGGRALRGGLIPRHLFLGFLKQRMGKGEVGLRYIIVNMRFIPLSIPDGEGREPKGRKGRGFGRRAAGRKGEARFETFNPQFDHL